VSDTPRTDAAEDRCLAAVRLFMGMPAAERIEALPEFIGDISNELLCESRQLERDLIAAKAALPSRDD
jgi:hypothetical protein